MILSDQCRGDGKDRGEKPGRRVLERDNVTLRFCCSIFKVSRGMR